MKFVGIPFKHNGRGFDGVDCLGIVKLYLNEQGLFMPSDDGETIEEEWYQEDNKRLLKGLESHFKRVDTPQENDVLLFKMRGVPRHLGVMIDHHRFLHIRKGKRSGIEKLRLWKKYLYRIYRHKELIE